ncbi:MAG: GTP-binding protein [Alphaproteobacteria bacterium]|nr:GTP-binding protein [Alphaproteobacteria bacterium]
MAERDPLAGKLPITLVTGFLGSGKTTLISKLLRHPGMNRAAVVINEVGEIGIDHDLVSTVNESMSLLANGCICCSVRTDLQDSLRELFNSRRAGQIPDFDRVIIETTGLADPAPVVQTLVSDTLINAHFRLDGLVTLVDAFHGHELLARQTEALKQAAMADRIFITKTDLVSPEQLRRLRDELRALNPQADQHTVVQGDLDPALLTGLGLHSARAGEHTLSFLGESLQGQTTGQEVKATDTSGQGKYLGARPSNHDPAIRTLSLRFSQPFKWPAFSSAMELLTTLRGPDMLRVKGIVNVEGHPVVVQGVQHIFSPPVELDQWPSQDRDTRLVFITRNIAPETICHLLSAVTSL